MVFPAGNVPPEMSRLLEAVGAHPAMDGRIVCWFIPLDVAPEVLEAGERWLDEAERERAARYHFEHHRRRFVARRAARRRILGSMLRVPPEAVPFREVGSGKPEVVRTSPDPFHFSASHSEEHAVVAVSTQVPLGIDIEVYRMVEGSLWEVRHLFADTERSALERVSERERARVFFDCWTRKEACVKADGAGLQIDLDTYEVPVGPLNAGVSVELAGRTSPDREIRLLPLSLGDELSAALAVVGPGEFKVEVRPWDWSEAFRH
jgi:4'-phosphopantetheinyl transferase